MLVCRGAAKVAAPARRRSFCVGVCTVKIIRGGRAISILKLCRNIYLNICTICDVAVPKTYDFHFTLTEELMIPYIHTIYQSNGPAELLIRWYTLYSISIVLSVQQIAVYYIQFVRTIRPNNQLNIREHPQPFCGGLYVMQTRIAENFAVWSEAALKCMTYQDFRCDHALSKALYSNY